MFHAKFSNFKNEGTVKRHENSNVLEGEAPFSTWVFYAVLSTNAASLFARLLVVKGICCHKDAAFIGAAILTAGVFIFNHLDLKRRTS